MARRCRRERTVASTLTLPAPSDVALGKSPHQAAFQLSPSLKCVQWMQRTHCDIFSHGRESFCISYTEVGTTCLLCKHNAWMHCTSQTHRFYEEKRENIHKNERSGWSSDATTDEIRCVVLAILKCDQWFTICEIWDLPIDKHSIEVSHMTIQCILATEDYTKICTRWVPKQLTNENKRALLEQPACDLTMILH